MQRLSYRSVFTQYKKSLSDSLTQIFYNCYKSLRLKTQTISPLRQFERVLFDERELSFCNDNSAKFPMGFDYVTKREQNGYVRLEYIDFFDFLPKEEIACFKKEIYKCLRVNGVAKYGAFRTKSDDRNIDNMGEYIDALHFSHLYDIDLSHSNCLNNYSSQLSISLRNISTSFLTVRYRFYISDAFNGQLKSKCGTDYNSYFEPITQSTVAWYNVKRYGKAFYSGNDARSKEIYGLISDLKWKALCELRRYFTLYFYKCFFFPPTFLTFATNIRPSNNRENQAFWSSFMLDSHVDYNPNLNVCVSWGYKEGEREGDCLIAFCGGNYSEKDLMPDFVIHDISEYYEDYLTANSIIKLAERDLAICNKTISKAIKRSKTRQLLKARVITKHKLYYSYRFISEYSGNSNQAPNVSGFHSLLFKNESFTSYTRKHILESIEKTKKKIDTFFQILNDAAEYGSSMSNIRMQWIMTVITFLSLAVTTITLLTSHDELFSQIAKVISRFLP